MKTALITLLAAIALATAHAQNGWKTYRNNAAGWSITYPPNLTLQPASSEAVAMDSSNQWRIKDFQSKDGEVELIVETHSLNADISLQDDFNYEVSNRIQSGDYINYRVISDNWYVISGTNAKGYEFYEKYARDFPVASTQDGSRNVKPDSEPCPRN